MMEEEARQQELLVPNQTDLIEVRYNKHLKEMEKRWDEISISADKLMDENNYLVQAYNEDLFECSTFWHTFHAGNTRRLLNTEALKFYVQMESLNYEEELKKER
ncbi:hypothetical protein ACOSQ2_032906 [Xanthoceras sorbifolium]